MDKNIEEYEGYIAYFESYLKSRGFSNESKRAYITDLRDFFNYLRITRINFCEENVTRYTVRSYLSHLKNRKLSNETMSRHLSSVKKFFFMLIRDGKWKDGKILLMSSPKHGKKDVNFLFEEEIKRLMSFEKEGFLAERNKFIFTLLYLSGLRVSEMCSLTIYDITDESRFLRIKGKGGKTREVPVLSVIKEKLPYYLILRESHLKLRGTKTDKLFLNRNGGALGTQGVRDMVKRVAKMLNMPRDFSPHTMRHTFATRLLENGAEIRALQEILGHASISTTQRYTHVTNKRMFEAYKKAHPHS